MSAALVRVQFDLEGSGVFVDAPAERVIGDIKCREGRNQSRLGGPVIPSQCSAFTMFLNNFDGYYTKGAGKALKPGSLARIQWRAVSSDAWVTRFQGRLSEKGVKYSGFSFLRTRWVGPLYYLTSGRIDGRLVLSNTPQQVMTVLADAGGVPGDARDFDTSATTYNRQLPGGYSGVTELESMVGGFVYDSPDYQVRLELPATRTAKVSAATYTDANPTGAMLGISPPEEFTRPFGIINHVQGQYEYYTPEDMTGMGMVVVNFPDASVGTNATQVFGWHGFQRTATLDFVPSPLTTVQGWSLTFRLIGQGGGGGFRVSSSGRTGTSGTTQAYTFVNSTYWLAWRNIAATIVGNTLCLMGEWRLQKLSGTGVDLVAMHLSGDITVMDGVSFEQDVVTFTREAERGGSIALYGYRPRPTPIIIGIYQATPLADDFVPDYVELDTAIQAELNRYSEPIPVFAVTREVAEPWPTVATY